MPNAFKNAYHDVTTVDTAVFTCPASTEAIVLVCRVSNVDGTNTAFVNARILDNDGSTDASIGKNIDVPAKATIELAGTSKLVLLAGDKLYLQAQADSDLEAFISILEIT